MADDNNENENGNENENEQRAREYVVSGLTKMRSDNWSGAIEDFTKAIELRPNYAEAYNTRGFASNMLGNYQQALVDCNKAIELKPDFALAYNNRGNAHNELKNYQQAIADFDKAIELNPNNAFVYSSRGRANNALENYQQAFADFYKAIELNPDFAAAYNNNADRYSCPCSRNGVTYSGVVPPFINNEYFCERGTNTEPMWDGGDCPSTSSCCSFNNPPWFCKQFSQPSSSDIEVRVCTDQPASDEDIQIELIELYIQ